VPQAGAVLLVVAGAVAVTTMTVLGMRILRRLRP
jgi:hypothetical protein